MAGSSQFTASAEERLHMARMVTARSASQVRIAGSSSSVTLTSTEWLYTLPFMMKNRESRWWTSGNRSGSVRCSAVQSHR
jgi:hypothetical protein